MTHCQGQKVTKLPDQVAQKRLIKFSKRNSVVHAPIHVYAPNSRMVLSNHHNFSPIIRNRGRWTRWWEPILDRKQEWRYFCACALKKSRKQRKCIPTEEVFPVQEFGVTEANREVRFLTGSS